jgi:hypothetical protein
MLYREIIAVCSQIHTKHINTLCGQNVELLNVKTIGTYSDRCAVHIVTISVTVCNLCCFQTSVVHCLQLISLTSVARSPKKHAWLHRARGCVRAFLAMLPALCDRSQNFARYGNKVIFDFTKHTAINFIQATNSTALNNV